MKGLCIKQRAGETCASHSGFSWRLPLKCMSRFTVNSNPSILHIINRLLAISTGHHATSLKGPQGSSWTEVNMFLSQREKRSILSAREFNNAGSCYFIPEPCLLFISHLHLWPIFSAPLQQIKKWCISVTFFFFFGGQHSFLLIPGFLIISSCKYRLLHFYSCFYREYEQTRFWTQFL